MKSRKGSQVVEFLLMAMLVLAICLTGLNIFGDSLKVIFEENTDRSVVMTTSDSTITDAGKVPGYNSAKELDRLLKEIQKISSSTSTNASQSLINIAQTLLDYFNYLKSTGIDLEELFGAENYARYMNLINAVLGLDLTGDINDTNLTSDMLSKLLDFRKLFDENEDDSLYSKLLKSAEGFPDNHPRSVIAKSLALLGNQVDINITTEDLKSAMIETIEAKKSEAEAIANASIDALRTEYHDQLVAAGITDPANASAEDIIQALQDTGNTDLASQFQAMVDRRTSLMELASTDDLSGLTDEEILELFLGLTGEVPEGLEVNTDGDPDVDPPDKFPPEHPEVTECIDKTGNSSTYYTDDLGDMYDSSGKKVEQQELSELQCVM